MKSCKAAGLLCKVMVLFNIGNNESLSTKPWQSRVNKIFYALKF